MATSPVTSVEFLRFILFERKEQCGNDLSNQKTGKLKSYYCSFYLLCINTI